MAHASAANSRLVALTLGLACGGDPQAEGSAGTDGSSSGSSGAAADVLTGDETGVIACSGDEVVSRRSGRARSGMAARRVIGDSWRGGADKAWVATAYPGTVHVQRWCAYSWAWWSVRVSLE
jgi:hypothetical protein